MDIYGHGHRRMVLADSPARIRLDRLKFNRVFVRVYIVGLKSGWTNRTNCFFEI